MTFIIGLGNPGEKYQDTRHNVGQKVLEKLSEFLSSKSEFLNNWEKSKKGNLLYSWFDINGEKVELVKTQTYMNESGKVLTYIKKKHPKIELSKVFVIHDDLDLELGNYKIQFGKGPKIHNGLLSIYQHLGTQEFWHLRIGIDARNSDRSIPPEKYVLMKFSKSEQEVVDRVIAEAAVALQEKIIIHES